jgi:glycine cleavage system H lipoate-binding protein
MGHDLITIYFLKAVEYVVAIAYLPLFVMFWRLVNPREPALARVPVTEGAWADQLRDFFRMPEWMYFHPGHTWARLESNDTVTVGIDGFARQLVGSDARFQLPAVGQAVSQGMPALSLLARGKSVDMLSPVDGTVVAVNQTAIESPATVQAAPYTDGWLMRIRSPKLAANLKNLMSGELARRWMDTVCERLGTEMRGHGHDLGMAYADGGTLVDGIAPNLTAEHWDEMARRFFLTENEEARHA